MPQHNQPRAERNRRLPRARSPRIAAWLLAVASFTAATAPFDSQAQSGGLYGAGRGPLTLGGSSWIYQEVEPPRKIQKNDIITIIVNERTQVLSEGEVQRRRQSQLDAVLADWLALRGFDLKPARQPDGDLKVSGSLTQRYRAENEMESRDSMQFTIAAKVKSVLPNGNLVIEAVRRIQNNNEVWEQSLIGEIRPEDVLPNNTVLSQNVADMRIYKREQGHVRDAVRRGWLFRFYDRFRLF